MKTLFIKECKNSKNLIQEIILKTKQIIGIISKENGVWEIPVNQTKQFNNKFITKKIAKKLYKNDVQKVVISNGLKKCNNLKLQLYDKNIDIIDGRILFEYLISDIIDYIFKQKDKEIGNEEISILVNNVNELALKNIVEIAKKVKRLNIVSNHLEQFRAIENYLYNELGIMVICSNNKKSSLIKSSIVINIDFIEESINKYKIPSEVVIINISDKINIKTKKFSGININYFNIEIPKKYRMKFFCNEEIYESIILKLSGYENIRNKIIKDDIRLTALIGNNGTINSREFLKM